MYSFFPQKKIHTFFCQVYKRERLKKKWMDCRKSWKIKKREITKWVLKKNKEGRPSNKFNNKKK